ncbi:MAG: chemotaxis protein CheW [Deltaproteobacteria bacterium]
MDLAKIRKKYRNPPAEDSTLFFRPEIHIAAPTVSVSEPVIDALVSPEADFLNSILPARGVQQPAAAPFFARTSSYRDPIEVILAGRSAAGCNEESAAVDELSSAVSENCPEYLCFRVSNEIYGINIMDIKEIIKPREVTEIPRAPHFVSGIISLRGTIIPVINMRFRLGMPCGNVTGKERVVVINIDQSLSGLLVDEVIQVLRIDEENMEPAPAVLEGIDRDFVSGIGRSVGRLIIILNLKSIADIQLF